MQNHNKKKKNVNWALRIIDKICYISHDIILCCCYVSLHITIQYIFYTHRNCRQTISHVLEEFHSKNTQHLLAKRNIYCIAPIKLEDVPKTGDFFSIAGGLEIGVKCWRL